MLTLGVWQLLGKENPPGWLAALLFFAIGLRLAAGVFWYVALPVWGFGNPAEQILIQIGDFDPENEHLESITLQYRRIGSNVWTDIQGSQVTADCL